MNLTRLPNPPNPAMYRAVPDWQAAVYDWMSNAKSIIEADSTVNTQPLAPIAVGTFTELNVIEGHDDTSNFVATLVSKMQKQGMTSANPQRGQPLVFPTVHMARPMAQPIAVTLSHGTSSLNLQGDPSIPIDPTGNPDQPVGYNTHSTLGVQGNTALGTNGREFLVNFGLTSDQGAGAAPNMGDKVCLYTALVANPGSGDVWTYNPLLTINPGAGRINAQCIELDLNNFNENRDLGDPIVSGLSLTGASTYNSTAAIWVDGMHQNSQWNHGIFVNSATKMAYIDNSTSGTSFKSQNAHTYGLDLEGTYTGAAIRLQANHNGAIRWHHSVYDYVDDQDNRFVGDGSANIITGSSVLCADDAAYYCGSPGRSWVDMYTYNFHNISDPNLKAEIRPLRNGMLEVVKDINPISFKWKTECNVVDVPPIEGKASRHVVRRQGRRKHFGFNAEDVAHVMSKHDFGLEFGGYSKDQTTGIQSLAPNQMLAVLWAAVQELSAKVDVLNNSTKGI